MKKKSIIFIIIILAVFIFGITFLLLKEDPPAEPQFDYRVFEVGWIFPIDTEYKGELVWGDNWVRHIELYYESDLKEYLVIVYEKHVIKSVVVFSENHKVLYQDNANLIDFNPKDVSPKMKYDDLVKLYGEPAAIMGSGECYPTYVTDDGRLIHFQHCSGSIGEWWQHDVTNEADWEIGF